jgi:hypothetical protein
MTTHLHLHPHPNVPLRGFAVLHPYAAEWVLMAVWAAIILLVWLGTS